MLLISPLQLFDVGFQLSFAAAFAIVYAIPKLNNAISKFRICKFPLIRYSIILILTTLTAQLAVLPITAEYFHKVPVIGMIANFPVIILTSTAIILGLILFALAPISVFLAAIIAFPLELILKFITKLLQHFASYPYASIQVPSPGWAAIILFWITAYIAYELLLKRYLSIRASIGALIALNTLVIGNIRIAHADWSIDFFDLDRNHAWLFRRADSQSLLCFDDYTAEEDAAEALYRVLLEIRSGKINNLISSTPNSPNVKSIADLIDCSIISAESTLYDARPYSLTRSLTDEVKYDTSFGDGIKIIWPQSDNGNRERGRYPALSIEVNDGVMLFAPWGEAQTLFEMSVTGNLKILELPWSEYAMSRYLNLIEKIKPDILIYSPDRFTYSMPGNVDELTHSGDKAISASMLGAFKIANFNDSLTIESMQTAVVGGASK